MEAKLRLTVAGGEAIDLVLKGPARAIEELIERLRAMAGPLDVTGGQCCWSMTGKDTTVHLVVDSDRAAS
ncbi:MAG TPA: hypothetical protein VNO22_16460 [Planctomycetota bacterium]|jgi:hypothetical protein|nr:hypothetical protein [Planctomycetota bacterium]